MSVRNNQELREALPEEDHIMKFTDDPEFNEKHKEDIAMLNLIMIKTIKSLYAGGMPVDNIAVAVPINGITSEQIQEILDR